MNMGILELFPEITTAFDRLASRPETIADTISKAIKLHCRTYPFNTFNDAGRYMFSQGTRKINIQPKMLLNQHIHTATYQAGYIWGQSLIVSPYYYCPTRCGLQRDGFRRLSV